MNIKGHGRPSCVDSPERAQPGGKASANRLRRSILSGQLVQIRPIDTHCYGRTFAEVCVADQSINLQLVQEGMAMVYTHYLDGCPDSRGQLLSAEQQARSARLGFWSQANPVMPWDWRQGSSSLAPSPSLSPMRTLALMNALLPIDGHNSIPFQSQPEWQQWVKVPSPPKDSTHLNALRSIRIWTCN